MIYNLDILAIAAIATVIATELLKSNLIPVPFQSFPRITAAVMSLVATIAAIMQTGYDITSSTANLTQFIAFAFATFVISAVTYNNIVKKN